MEGDNINSQTIEAIEEPTNLEAEEQARLVECTETYDNLLRQWSVFNTEVAENLAFANGDHWDPKLRKVLEDDGRPVMTMDIASAFIEQLIAQVIGRSTSWKVLADEGGVSDVADKLTEALFAISNNNEFDYTKEDVFTDGVIQRIGKIFIPPMVDEADIFIENDAGSDVMINIDARDKFQSDWRMLVRSRWMTPREMIDAFPQKRKDILDRIPDAYKYWSELTSAIDILNSSSERITIGSETLEPVHQPDQGNFYDSRVGRIRVVELWKRDKHKVMVTEPELDELGNILSVGEEGERYFQKVYVCAPFLNLYLGSDEFPYYFYPEALFFFRHRGGTLMNTRSYVDILKEPQRAKNSVYSMAVDYLQKTSDGSKVLPAGEGELKKDIDKRGSKTAQTFVRATTQGEIVDLNSHGLPPELMQVTNMVDVDYQRVSQQPLPMQGMTQSETDSGVLFNSQVRQGEIGFTPVMRSFSQFLRLVAMILIERIQVHYKAPREFSYYDNNNVSKSIVINDPYSIETDNHVSVGRYKPVISDESYSRTQKEMELRSLLDLIKILPPIPQIHNLILPKIVEASGVSDAYALAEQVNAILNGITKQVEGQQQTQQIVPQGLSSTRPSAEE